MTALNDRRLWLLHLHECTRCPVDLCDKGLELAAAVEESLAPGESWQGVWRAQLPKFRRQLGTEFRRIRHEKGLRLADVSAVSHVSTPYLSQVETGQAEASSDVIAAICNALDVIPQVILHQRNAPLNR